MRARRRRHRPDGGLRRPGGEAGGRRITSPAMTATRGRCGVAARARRGRRAGRLAGRGCSRRPTSSSSPRPSRMLAVAGRGRCSSAAPERCTVTDVGSTKDVVGAASGDRFVGGHPVCGREAHGPAHATAELFDGRDLVPDPGGRHRPRPLPARARVRRLARRRAGRDRPASARPAGRADEPPAARAREPARQPGRRGADRGPRPAGGGRRLAARHDTGRRREPADLGRHLPRQRRRARARRWPSTAAGSSSSRQALAAARRAATSPAGSPRPPRTAGGCSPRPIPIPASSSA